MSDLAAWSSALETARASKPEDEVLWNASLVSPGNALDRMLEFAMAKVRVEGRCC